MIFFVQVLSSNDFYYYYLVRWLLLYFIQFAAMGRNNGTPEQVFNNPRVHNSIIRDGNNGTTVDSTVVTVSTEVK
jgi:hypothetical protein